MLTALSSHGAGFGFRWSALGCVVALLYIASCDLFVPPDRSTPRYNTVRGERHRPLLNPGGAGYRPEMASNNVSASVDAAYGTAPMPAPQPAADSAAFVEMPAPQAPRANIAAPAPEKSFWGKMAFWREDAPAQPAPDAQRPQQDEKGFWSSLAFWRDDAPAPRPAPSVAPVAPAPVAVMTAPVVAADLAPLPNTNQQPMQLAGGKFPKLSSTPERPDAAAIDAARQRGAATRSELQSMQGTAGTAREQLLKDAQAEPSLLDNPPPASPVHMLPPPAPVLDPAPVSQSAPIAAPTQTAFGRLTGEPMASALKRAVPKENPQSTVPTGVGFPTPVAMSAPAPLEPIRLVPPSSMALSQGTQTAALEGVPADMAPPPAGAVTLQPLPTRYAGAGFLPQSRYARRRLTDASVGVQ